MTKLKRRQTDDVAKDVISSIKRRKKVIKTTVEFLNSGSTRLNLALSGKGKHGGWARGRINNIVGDGSSGKTLLALELCFWFFKYITSVVSKIYPKVKKVIICYDNAEGVMDFPVETMYGKDFYNAIDWTRSKNFEHFCRRFLKLTFNLKKGESLLYIIDSWDAFQSAKSQKAFKESIESDTDLKGDYDLLVQKYASRKFFPSFCQALDHNKIDVTLVIVSQIRSKIGVTFGKKQTRTGGKALDFYTHMVAWIKEIEKLSGTKLKEKRVFGIRSSVKVERSKVAKPFRESEFTILYDYGLDDVGSMIDYIYGSGKKISGRFNSIKFKTREKLIKYIEKNSLEDLLIEKTEKRWDKVEKAFSDEIKKRKPRY
jgi:RecA/RadA recombinase